MASDSVSSVAYAGEEILLVLVPVLGISSFRIAPLVTLPIILLLLILIMSYSQVIDRYPMGGGAYNVTKENLGRYPSLIAASSLVVDYIMTVAVSISSASAAITSAFPAMRSGKTWIALLFIVIITLGNLRGLRESARLFGTPTYIFIASMGVMIIVGLVKLMAGGLNPIVYSPTDPNLVAQNFSADIGAISIVLLLHAFASGCTALTGVEAVSDAVPSFREPSQKNAKAILFMLGGVNVFIFGGTILLASLLHVMPLKNVTVVSQIASAVFGGTIFSFMYYVIQIFTALILILAANTAFNGLPVLLYILAHDGFVPRQFAHRGTKLSFSNGILFIFVIASLLIWGFGADTHKMIPMYTIGVFISFTLCQFGMVRCWWKNRGKGWHYKMFINAFGTLMTLVSTCVVIFIKFTEGAWAVVIAIPIIMTLMVYCKKHYTLVSHELELKRFYPYYEDTKPGSTQCIVLLQSINKSLLKSLNYAKTISSDITALHVCRHPEHAAELRKQWDELKLPVKLEIILTPYQDIIHPLDNYIWERESKLHHGEFLSVIIVKFMTNHWYDSILHNQTTYFMERILSRHKNVTSIILPFHYNPGDFRTEGIKWLQKSDDDSVIKI
jgi:amino acid transporter